jgi:hypothetical protein
MKTIIEKILPIGVLVAIFAGLVYLTIEESKQEASLTQEQRDARDLHNECFSKRKGSRPMCWTQKDWDALCSRIACMPAP